MLYFIGAAYDLDGVIAQIWFWPWRLVLQKIYLTIISDSFFEGLHNILTLKNDDLSVFRSLRWFCRCCDEESDFCYAKALYARIGN